MVTVVEKNNRKYMLCLMLPGLLIFSVFVVFPIVKLFINSFQDWNISSLDTHKFTWFANFKEVFEDPYFIKSLQNTLLYTLLTVPFQMILGLLAAVLVNNVPRLSVVFRTMFYLPVLTSWVIASLMFKFLFNQEGILNYVLTNILHITSYNVNWLSTGTGGMLVAICLGTWKGIGWNMMVFLSALQGISRNLYEAASLDGASRWKQFLYITLPSIRGTVLFTLVMLTIGGFNVYTSIVMITGGGPAHETETVLSWMYYKAFQTGNFGYASALSIIIAMMLAVLAYFQFKLMKEK